MFTMSEQTPAGFRRLAAVSIALAGIMVLGPSAARAAEYAVTDLGTIAGPVSSAFGLNAGGQVVGVSTVASGNFHGVLFGPSPTDLGVAAGDTQGSAAAINDAGQVVGYSYNYGDLKGHALLWNGGAPTAIGAFLPRDLNNLGVVVGRQTTYVGSLWVEHACQYSSGTLTDLGTLGGRCSEANAVGDDGRVVGQSFLANDQTFRACLWQNGTPRDLGTLTGAATACSSAADLNAAGQIVGWSDTASGAHACRFTVDAAGNVTNRTDLGVLSGNYSYAYGINATGVIVGLSNSRAVVWRGGAIADLNALIPPGTGWQLFKASAVNDAGQIVGEGGLNGFQHAFLLTPSTCLRGDVNGDGLVNGLDVHAFVNVLQFGGTPNQICAGDLAAAPDGAVTTADVANFVTCLLAGGC